jgi:ankyrin repeat protein
VVYRRHKPEQPVEDLREAIDGLRDQTAELELQPPAPLQSQSYSQLIDLARDTVSDGETIYAQSIAGGSVVADDLEIQPNSTSSVMAWLHQQVHEASQRALQPTAEEVDDSVTSTLPGVNLPSSVGLPTPEPVERLDEVDYELESERSIIHKLFNDVRVLFDTESYYDAKCRLLNMLAGIRELKCDVPGLFGYYDLQYMLAVATFYTTDSLTSQKVLLDFVGQEVTDDEHRLKAAHASQLLAEGYVNAGELRCAKLSCGNALRTHYQLSRHGDRAKDECFALAARIESLLGNHTRAETLSYAISTGESEACIARYKELGIRKSMTIDERTALFENTALQRHGSRLFEGFKLSENGRLELLADKQNSDSRQKTMITPLFFAVMSHDVSYALALIEDGADVNAEARVAWDAMHISWEDEIVGPYGLTLMAYALALGNEDMVRLLFSRGASLSRSAGSQSPVVILAADAFDTSLRILSFLKHLGWDPDSPMDALDNTLLHVATGQLRPELMKQLMSGRSSAFVHNCEGDLPLHLLLRMDRDGWNSRSWSMAKILLQREVKEQLNSKDRGGMTALHHIVRFVEYVPGREGQPDTDLVRYCIEHGADVTIKDDHGNIPLSLTLSGSWRVHSTDVERSLANADRLLRNHTQVQLSSRNCERRTPLQVALTTEWQFEALVLMYLNAGADPFDRDDTGRTPFERIIQDRPHWRKANQLVWKIMRTAGLKLQRGSKNSPDAPGALGEASIDHEKKELVDDILRILKEYRSHGLNNGGELDVLLEQAAPYMDEAHVNETSDTGLSTTDR